MNRHTRRYPCEICDGHAEMPHGRGVRCAGFTLDTVAYCTREEYAGRLTLDEHLSPPAYKHFLGGPCGCGVQHGSERRRTEFRRQPPPRQERPASPIEVRDQIYSFALTILPLRSEALADLYGRGLPDEVIGEVGYRSLPRKGKEHESFMQSVVREFGEARVGLCPGFRDKNGRLAFRCALGRFDGYVVPYRDEHHRISGLQVKVLGGKYRNAQGMSVREVYHVAGDAGSKRDLYVTEGGLKAQVAAYHGRVWTLGIPGQALQPEHIGVIQRLEPSRVIVALDEERNPNTDAARERWCKAIWTAGLPTFRATWEGEL